MIYAIRNLSFATGIAIYSFSNIFIQKHSINIQFVRDLTNRIETLFLASCQNMCSRADHDFKPNMAQIRYFYRDVRTVTSKSLRKIFWISLRHILNWDLKTDMHFW